MFQITSTISIEDSDIKFDFIRASGPGGQNVNKVSTAVQLRFHVRNSSLPDDIKERLIDLAGNRLTSEGELIIKAKRYRTQLKNRQDALHRLITLIEKAAIPLKARKKSKPSQASKLRRLEAKRRRSEIKRTRRQVIHFHD